MDRKEQLANAANQQGPALGAIALRAEIPVVKADCHDFYDGDCSQGSDRCGELHTGRVGYGHDYKSGYRLEG